MNLITLFLGAAGMALPALAQTPAATPMPLLHVTTSFDLVVHAPSPPRSSALKASARGPASTGTPSSSIHSLLTTNKVPSSPSSTAP